MALSTRPREFGCFGYQLQWMHSGRGHAAGPGMAAGLAFPLLCVTAPCPQQHCAEAAAEMQLTGLWFRWDSD